jgi:hypothetical protein
MKIDHFTPLLLLAIVAISVAAGAIVLVFMLWAGDHLSTHGYIAIFLGASFTAAAAMFLSLAMHISQVRKEAEEAEQAERAARDGSDPFG